MIRANSKPDKTKPLIGITADVQIEAGAVEGGPKKFSVVAYTGGPMEVKGYDLPVVVDLDGLTFAKSIVANLDHDQQKRVGNVTERSVENGQLTLSGIASASTPARDEVIASAADGFVWQASIEARPSKIKPLDKGATATVNGQTVKGPAYLVQASTLRGFAFVSHGADDNTTVDIAATADTQQGDEMDPKLKAWIEAMGFVADDLTEQQVEAMSAQYNGQQPPKKAEHKSVDDVIADAKSERARQQRIADITAENLTYRPDCIDEIQALAQEAIDANWSPEGFEGKLAIQMVRRDRPQAHSHVSGKGGNSRRLDAMVIEAAVCKAAGMQQGDLERHYKPETLEAMDGRYPMGCGLRELFILGARANGYNHQGTDITLDVQRAAFGYGGRNAVPIHAAGFSTLSVPNILSNTANKFLQRGFMAVDGTWRSISRIRSVRNFQQHTSYTLTGDLSYDKLGATGEIKHGTLGEETYTNQADTYARMMGISRRDLINDDLMALSDVPMRLGRGAALKLNNVFWTEFLDNSSFFTSGNSNVSTGAGSAFGQAGLEAAEVIFINQTDPDGQPLGLMPEILLVPPTLKSDAYRETRSQQVIATDQAASASTIGGSANPWVGRFAVQSSPYMENSSYTGNSTAAWYLLANPADLATIEVAFLNGREAPVVETADADFNMLGVQMRGYHDFGVNKQEPRAGVRSAGS